MHFLTPYDRSLKLGWFPLPELVQIKLDGAPAYLKGVRALFVSDVHLRRSTADAKLNALTTLMQSCRADLLLLGGDYAESEETLIRFMRALSTLTFPLGAYAVIGNNDILFLETLKRECEKANIHLLDNCAKRIAIAGGIIEIGGCEDHVFGEPRTRGLFGGEGYRILLSHCPCMPECACELMLSGHTHAGQFNFFGLTPYSIGFEHALRPLALRGLHEIKGMRLLVGNGIGVSRLPLRFGAAPQIYCFDFV